MTAIVEAVTDVLTMVSSIFTWMLDNPLMLFYVGASLIPVGFVIFKKAKNSAK